MKQSVYGGRVYIFEKLCGYQIAWFRNVVHAQPEERSEERILQDLPRRGHKQTSWVDALHEELHEEFKLGLRLNEDIARYFHETNQYKH